MDAKLPQRDRCQNCRRDSGTWYACARAAGSAQRSAHRRGSHGWAERLATPSFGCTAQSRPPPP
eukprot:349640-Chlamydomonas_euryale.AAC.6